MASPTAVQTKNAALIFRLLIDRVRPDLVLDIMDTMDLPPPSLTPPKFEDEALGQAPHMDLLTAYLVAHNLSNTYGKRPGTDELFKRLLDTHIDPKAYRFATLFDDGQYRHDKGPRPVIALDLIDMLAATGRWDELGEMLKSGQLADSPEGLDGRRVLYLDRLRHASTSQSITLLTGALREQKNSVAKILLAKGMTPDGTEGTAPPLFSARNAEAAKLLMTAGASPYCKDKNRDIVSFWRENLDKKDAEAMVKVMAQSVAAASPSMAEKARQTWFETLHVSTKEQAFNQAESLRLDPDTHWTCESGLKLSPLAFMMLAARGAPKSPPLALHLKEAFRDVPTGVPGVLSSDIAAAAMIFRYHRTTTKTYIQTAQQLTTAVMTRRNIPGEIFAPSETPSQAYIRRMTAALAAIFADASSLGLGDFEKPYAKTDRRRDITAASWLATSVLTPNKVSQALSAASILPSAHPPRSGEARYSALGTLAKISPSALLPGEIHPWRAALNAPAGTDQPTLPHAITALGFIAQAAKGFAPSSHEGLPCEDVAHATQAILDIAPQHFPVAANAFLAVYYLGPDSHEKCRRAQVDINALAEAISRPEVMSALDKDLMDKIAPLIEKEMLRASKTDEGVARRASQILSAYLACSEQAPAQTSARANRL